MNGLSHQVARLLRAVDQQEDAAVLVGDGMTLVQIARLLKRAHDVGLVVRRGTSLMLSAEAKQILQHLSRPTEIARRITPIDGAGLFDNLAPRASSPFFDA